MIISRVQKMNSRGAAGLEPAPDLIFGFGCAVHAALHDIRTVYVLDVLQFLLCHFGIAMRKIHNQISQLSVLLSSKVHMPRFLLCLSVKFLLPLYPSSSKLPLKPMGFHILSSVPQVHQIGLIRHSNPYFVKTPQIVSP